MRNSRIIKCPKCDKSVEEAWQIEGHGITEQSAWCTCGWGGSYPFQKKNPFTQKYAWEVRMPKAIESTESPSEAAAE